jgi:hypothetical protein
LLQDAKVGLPSIEKYTSLPFDGLIRCITPSLRSQSLVLSIPMRPNVQIMFALRVVDGSTSVSHESDLSAAPLDHQAQVILGGFAHLLAQ